MNCSSSKGKFTFMGQGFKYFPVHFFFCYLGIWGFSLVVFDTLDVLFLLLGNDVVFFL